MGRPEVRVVVLFEDQEQECFLRHLARRLGLRPVRYENCQNNAGVIQRLGREVDAPSLEAARGELARVESG